MRCRPSRIRRSVVQLFALAGLAPAPANHLHELIGDDGDERMAFGADGFVVIDGAQAEFGFQGAEHGFDVAGGGAPSGGAMSASNAPGAGARTGGAGDAGAGKEATGAAGRLNGYAHQVRPTRLPAACTPSYGAETPRPPGRTRSAPYSPLRALQGYRAERRSGARSLSRRGACQDSRLGLCADAVAARAARGFTCLALSFLGGVGGTYAGGKTAPAVTSA